MRMLRNKLMLFVTVAVLSITQGVQAHPLTPPHEPKEDSFYVCYDRCYVHHSIRAPLNTYRKLRYKGCVISRVPCNASCVKKKHCPPVPLKLFGWFNNYPQSLNAFYRCAYN